ncbi:hypothetical protein [Mesorhizobium amorphae]|uniref:hypothetical protein n=1 Tax=Mesorhizobium amorphae TaxID=71433 RepID=UPI001182F668|nr:hypothetical protein [Mesorhizobium amorphae]
MPPRHKGIITDAGIDRRWPYQVALHAEVCAGDQFAEKHEFACTLNEAPRRRMVMKKEPTGYSQRYILFCFAAEEDADAFAIRFEGYHFDPTKDRVSRKSNVWRWEGWGAPVRRYAEIVARLERVRSWEPSLDADIGCLLDVGLRTRFTRCRESVEDFLYWYIPLGEWHIVPNTEFDARVRHYPEAAWRSACENRTKPRENEATALTLAFLRGCAYDFAT